MPAKEFDLNEIIQKFGIEDYLIKNVTNTIGIETLKDIYDDYRISLREITTDRDKIMRTMDGVLNVAHSIRTRVKNEEHLIEKIIRNLYEKPDKYSNICKANYYKIITDLFGFRIIILGKEDWRIVHKYIEDNFLNDSKKYIDSKNFANMYIEKIDNFYLAEKPVVYTLKGDEGFYDSNLLDIKTSKVGYRSLHYIIRHDTYYFEIQVRTIFEEGWLEFDHKIKYPYDRENPLKCDLMLLMSNIAKASDDLISFYTSHLSEICNKYKDSTMDNIVLGDGLTDTDITDENDEDDGTFKSRLNNRLNNL